MKGKNVFSVFFVLVLSIFMAVSANAAVPVISAPASQSVNEGQLVSFTVTSTDASGHSMAFTTANLPSGATFTTTASTPGSITGQFTWVPNFNQAGTHNFAITATDTLGNSASSALSITVNDVPSPTTPSGVQIVDVNVDGVALTESSTNFVVGLERGETFDVEVQVRSNSDARDVQVSAEVRGFDNGDLIEDITDTFDTKAGVTYLKRLELRLPEKLKQDRYKLRVQVEDRDSPTVEKTFELEIGTARHALRIKDVVLNPEREVVAGRSLIAIVRVQNVGEKTEEGIKVRASVPALGVSAVDFIDELESADEDDDEASSEELFMRIPANAEPGDYRVVIDVEFRDGDELVTQTSNIRVVSAETFPPATAEAGRVTITFPSEKTDVAAGGAGTAFPITFTNTGNTARVFTVEVEPQDWATVRVSPGSIVNVRPGETMTAFVFVSANEETAPGERAVVVNVKDTSGQSVRQISLRANVAGEAKKPSLFGDSRRLLEVGLIVLIVALAVIALLVAFQRLKGGKEEDEEEGGSQTYY